GSVERTGITGVDASAVRDAATRGLVIKLIASADAGGRATVARTEVARHSVLGSTDGATNVVELRGWPVGTLVFQGPGAGADPTSSAVLADLLALARGEGSTWGALPPAPPAGS
ncbi:MAG TPA: hypothetical protein VH741_07975, partial [Candidatus Limnocylindrales bacterium]